MNIKDLRAISTSQLKERVSMLAKELCNLRLQKTTRQSVLTHRFSLLRKQIAQIKTILCMREREHHE